jgi:predicted HicB family RNase H-like nuclease
MEEQSPFDEQKQQTQQVQGALRAEVEQQADIAAAGEPARFKTLGVRLEAELHAQLSFIAQLSGHTLAEEIRNAIQGRVIAAQTDADLVARAEAVRAEIEREAAARRQAIAGFFGATAVDSATPQQAAPATRPGDGQPRRGRAR